MLRRNSQPGVFNPTLNCLPDGVPKGDLLPEPFKIIHSAGVIVVLYEVETTFRQIFTDGRKLPADPSPSWQGDSVGRWEGDTLVVDTAGFNDRGWLDARGTGHSSEMRIEERFRRPIRPPGSHDYHHGSQDLHPSDHRQRRRRAPAGHRPVRALLSRKRKRRRALSGQSSKVSLADLFSDAVPRRTPATPSTCKTLNASKNRP